MTTRISVLVLSLFATASCSKTAGDVLRPDEHTGAAAAGAELDCDGAPSRIRPLVVDWSPDDRVDLEAAMQGSVIVVKYDCPTMEILPGCTVDGSYSYAGVSRKEQVIQMSNMDDIHANIPVSSGSVGGEIKSGRAIDLATVLVGRRSTTVNHLTTEQLSGQCEGATHFLRSASLGAFSMGTGTVGKAAVVAEMFGVGGGASSESERKALNTDGNLDSCRESDPSASAPPSECQAPVRIELMALAEDGGKAKDKDARKTAVEENPCLQGYVFANGMCTRPSDDTPTLCDPENTQECKEQCDKGSYESCLNYGRLISDDAAMIPYKAACDHEVWAACTALGEKVYYKDMDEEQPGQDELATTAFGLLAQACDGGHGYGCELKGDMLDDKKVPMFDEKQAFSVYMRACDLGSSFGCYTAATRQLQGVGTPVDVKAGMLTLARSCQGGSSDECKQLGDIFREGQFGVSKQPEKAVKLYAVACQMDVDWCEGVGELVVQSGDPAAAAAMYDRDCSRNKKSASCGRLGELYVAGTGVDKDEEKGKALMSQACDAYDEASCKALGRAVPE